MRYFWRWLATFSRVRPSTFMKRTMALGTAPLSPRCATASTNRWCSSGVHTILAFFLGLPPRHAQLPEAASSVSAAAAPSSSSSSCSPSSTTSSSPSSSSKRRDRWEGESSKAAKVAPAMLIRNAVASAGVMSGCQSGVSSEAEGRPISHSSTRPERDSPSASMPARRRGGENEGEREAGAAVVAWWGRPPRGDNITNSPGEVTQGLRPRRRRRLGFLTMSR
nr:unnamed protein product [Digitaria exilis]